MLVTKMRLITRILMLISEILMVRIFPISIRILLRCINLTRIALSFDFS